MVNFREMVKKLKDTLLIPREELAVEELARIWSSLPRDFTRCVFEQEDSRGKVYSFRFNDEPLRELMIMYTKAGAVRGGDYHSHRQYTLVLQGRLAIIERYSPEVTIDYSGGKVTIPGEKVHYLNEGDFVVFEPGIPHWLVSLTDSWFIEFFEHPKTVSFYKPYRKIVEELKKRKEK